jgi:hypothetical protein
MRVSQLCASASGMAMVGAVLVAGPALANGNPNFDNADPIQCVEIEGSTHHETQHQTVRNNVFSAVRTNSTNAAKWVGTETTEAWEHAQERVVTTVTTGGMECVNPQGKVVHSTGGASVTSHSEWATVNSTLLSTTTCFINPARTMCTTV